MNLRNVEITQNVVYIYFCQITQNVVYISARGRRHLA